jgi:hypothetical protein
VRYTFDDRHYVTLFQDAWHFLPSEANVRWFKSLAEWHKQAQWDQLLDLVGFNRDFDGVRS